MSSRSIFVAGVRLPFLRPSDTPSCGWTTFSNPLFQRRTLPSSESRCCEHECASFELVFNVKILCGWPSLSPRPQCALVGPAAPRFLHGVVLMGWIVASAEPARLRGCSVVRIHPQSVFDVLLFRIMSSCLVCTAKMAVALFPTAPQATEKSPTSLRQEGTPSTGSAGSATGSCRCSAGASCMPRGPSW